MYGFDSRGRTLPGWPASINQGSGGTRGYPAIGTADDQRAIFTLDQLPNSVELHAIGTNGGLLGGGWPWATGPDPSAYAYSGPTLATDSNDEQTIYVRAHTSSNESLIYALDPSGAVKPGWPVDSGPRENALSSLAPTSPIAAFDGSVYTKSGEGGVFGNESRGKLLGFLPSGDPKPGWPFRFPDGQRLWYTSPAAGDNDTVYVATNYFEDHGQPDWLTTLRSYLYAFSPAGRVMAGWPREVPGLAFGTPAVAADGTTYFLVAQPIRTASDNDAGTKISVYAFSDRGEQKQGWPKVVYTSEHGALTPPPLWGIALDREGNVFVPGGSDFLLGPPTPGNWRARMHGFTPQGRSLPGWPFRVPNTGLLTPALGNDGVIYTLGISEDGIQLYAIKSGKRPRRCDPRLSARRCPPRTVKGSVGKLRPAGKGRR